MEVCDKISHLWELQEVGIGLNMFGLVWKGPEIEDRQLLNLERSLETQWNTGEFSKQDPVILILKLKGGRPSPNIQ